MKINSKRELFPAPWAITFFVTLTYFDSFSHAEERTILKLNTPEKVVRETTPEPTAAVEDSANREPAATSQNPAANRNPVRARPRPALLPKKADASAPPPSPIRGSYTLEYEGNRFGQPLDQVTSPSGEISGAALLHDARIAYGFPSKQAIGLRGQLIQNLQTVSPDTGVVSPNFVAKDLRVFLQWVNMISTPDLDMTGVLDVVLPTSEKSVLGEKILQLNIKNNWTIKTSLRNWYFSATTLIAPLWFKVPFGKPDYIVAIYPNVAVDLAPDWQLVFDASFDAAHNNSANFFDYQNADPDYITVGPQWTVNSHITLYPGIRFYTENLAIDVATLYLNFTAAL
jgi:hypothetical protein